MGGAISLAEARLGPPGGWSGWEERQLARLKAGLARTDRQLDWASGAAEDGSPWIVAVDRDTEDLLLHLARIGSQYVLLAADLSVEALSDRLDRLVDAKLSSKAQHRDAKIIRGVSFRADPAVMALAIAVLLADWLRSGAGQPAVDADDGRQGTGARPAPLRQGFDAFLAGAARRGEGGASRRPPEPATAADAQTAHAGPQPACPGHHHAAAQGPDGSLFDAMIRIAVISALILDVLPEAAAAALRAEAVATTLAPGADGLGLANSVSASGIADVIAQSSPATELAALRGTAVAAPWAGVTASAEAGDGSGPAGETGVVLPGPAGEDALRALPDAAPPPPAAHDFDPAGWGTLPLHEPEPHGWSGLPPEGFGGDNEAGGHPPGPVAALMALLAGLWSGQEAATNRGGFGGFAWAGPFGDAHDPPREDHVPGSGAVMAIPAQGPAPSGDGTARAAGNAIADMGDGAAPALTAAAAVLQTLLDAERFDFLDHVTEAPASAVESPPQDEGAAAPDGIPPLPEIVVDLLEAILTDVLAVTEQGHAELWPI